MGNSRAYEVGHATRWRPGESGNPSGKSAQIEAARALVREFMVNGGGLTAWMGLILDKDPKVRMYVFRDLVRFAFGWAPQEIQVERHSSTISLDLRATASPERYQEIVQARQRIQALLLGGQAPLVTSVTPDGEGDAGDAAHEADGSSTAPGNSGGHET